MGQTVNLLSFDFGGSNPSLPTNNTAEVAQLIEHQPSKLRVAGLSPVSRSRLNTSYFIVSMKCFFVYKNNTLMDCWVLTDSYVVINPIQDNLYSIFNSQIK